MASPRSHEIRFRQLPFNYGRSRQFNRSHSSAVVQLSSLAPHRSRWSYSMNARVNNEPPPSHDFCGVQLLACAEADSVTKEKSLPLYKLFESRDGRYSQCSNHQVDAWDQTCDDSSVTAGLGICAAHAFSDVVLAPLRWD